LQILQAGKIVTEDEILKDSYLLIDKGKIKAIKKEFNGQQPVKSYLNKIIAPGYIDVHTHGGVGFEIGTGESDDFEKWCDFKLRHGVTAFLATTASIPLEKLERAVAQLKKLKNTTDRANVLGLHLEGPFFSQGKKLGAQNPEAISDKFISKYRNFIAENAEDILYLSLDPLVEDAEQIIDFCRQQDIKLAAGHSEILYQDFLKQQHNYQSIVHTFNGMRGLHHRKPGLAYTACMDRSIYAEIICDGFHVIYPMLKLFFKLKDVDKSIIITDAMQATGMPANSCWSIGDREVSVDAKGQVRLANGSLAGSTLTMDQAVRNLVENADISVFQAVKSATLNPARMLGVADRKGSLQKGKDADFIILDEKLFVEQVYLAGQRVFP